MISRSNYLHFASLFHDPLLKRGRSQRLISPPLLSPDWLYIMFASSLVRPPLPPLLHPFSLLPGRVITLPPMIKSHSSPSFLMKFESGLSSSLLFSLACVGFYRPVRIQQADLVFPIGDAAFFKKIRVGEKCTFFSIKVGIRAEKRGRGGKIKGHPSNLGIPSAPGFSPFPVVTLSSPRNDAG